MITNNKWGEMIDAAKTVAARAYAPYSKFPVGAALLSADESIIIGCNVENAAYPLGNCAERGAISAAIANGHRQFKGLVVFTDTPVLTPPCGACRQVIAEFFPPSAEIKAVNNEGESASWTVGELLPDAFTPSHLKDSQDI